MNGHPVRRCAVGAVLGSLLFFAFDPGGAQSAAAEKLRNGRIVYNIPIGNCPDFASTCPRQLKTVRPDGSGKRVLPCGFRPRRECYDTAPSFSNDGHRIASLTRNNAYVPRLVIRRADGRILSRTVFDAFSVAWSPNDESLALAGFRVIVRSLRSARNRRLRMGTPYNAAWSRQGDIVADSDVFFGPLLIRGPRGGRRRINVRGDKPEWSPDGRRIAYNCNGETCVVNRDGTGKKILTRQCDGESGLAWSPDGKQLACHGPDLITINLRTHRSRVLDKNATLPDDLDWQALPARTR